MNFLFPAYLVIENAKHLLQLVNIEEGEVMNKETLIMFSEILLSMKQTKEEKKESSMKPASYWLYETPVIQMAVKILEANSIKTIESMNAMAKEGILIRGIDYDTAVDSDGDYVLRLNYSKFYDRFIDYCKRKNREHHLLTLGQFKTLLRIQSYCKEYNRPVQFNSIPFGYTYRKLYRAALLKVHDLKNLGADIEFMLER